MRTSDERIRSHLHRRRRNGGSSARRRTGHPHPARRRTAYGPYRALFNVSFRVPEGGVVALVGSNGAGKSTVARTVTGLVTATSGEVHFAGQDVTHLAAFKIARLGMAHVVEGRGVFSTLTVEENLTLAFRQRAGRGKLGENLKRAYEAFPILGERRRQTAGTLSGGQQRLLSLAKVLWCHRRCCSPTIVVGPRTGLVDAVVRRIETDQWQRDCLGGGRAAGASVLALATRAVVLEHGSVFYEGEPRGAAKAVESLMARREEAAASGAAVGSRGVETGEELGLGSGVATGSGGRCPRVRVTWTAARGPNEKPERYVDGLDVDMDGS